MQLKTQDDVVAWGNAFEARVVEQMAAQHGLNERMETRLNAYSAEQRELLQACAKLGEQMKQGSGSSKNHRLRSAGMIGGGGVIFGLLEFVRHVLMGE